jgi:hypothetical protein
MFVLRASGWNCWGLACRSAKSPSASSINARQRVFFAFASEPCRTGFFAFAATYVFACILGVASNAPGGIGVSKAMLKAVPVASEEALLASLVLFRHLLPRAFPVRPAFLGAHEGFATGTVCASQPAQQRGRNRLEDAINSLRRWYRTPGG